MAELSRTIHPNPAYSLDDVLAAKSRFDAFVVPAGVDACWLWTGSKTSRGYGRFSLKGVARRSHRVAWEIANNRLIPHALVVCHRCDNPSCVNPAHLFVGTLSDNAQDCLSKGRHPLKSLTHCKRGHDLTDQANVRFNKLGHRTCRACHKPYSRAWNKKRSEERAAGRALRVEAEGLSL